MQHHTPVIKKMNQPSAFQWSQLGDIEIGRPNMGTQTHVNVYRLLQHSLRHVLERQYGQAASNDLFFKAGKISGQEFCHHNMNGDLPFFDFIPHLQAKLRDLGIGILRIEHSNPQNFHITLTLEEDLDCSGTPVTGQTLCHYDEGFLAGIFECYSGHEMEARELECWGTGSQTCLLEILKKS